MAADQSKPDDQDALAADWGMSLQDEGDEAVLKPAAGEDDMAAQWAAMIDEGGAYAQVTKTSERVLHQDEIELAARFQSR